MPNKRSRVEDSVEKIKTDSQSLNYRIHTLVGEVRELEASGDNEPFFADKEGGEAVCTLKLKSPCCARISEMMLKCADSEIIMKYLKSYSVVIWSPLSAEFVFGSRSNSKKSVAIMHKAVELVANVVIMFDDEVCYNFLMISYHFVKWFYLNWFDFIYFYV